MFASRIGRVSNFCVIVMVLLSVLLLGGVCLGSMGDGPSLLVYESEYAELRSRTSDPWNTIKLRAINKANAGYGSVGTGDYSLVQTCLTSAALSYILDEPNKAFYKDRIYDGIVNQLDELDIGESYAWSGVVYGGNTVFAAINALDAVYPYLTAAQQTACIDKIQTKVSSISTSGNWPLARKGLHGTWDIFRGVSYNPDTYYNEVMADLTSGGVFRGGCTYARSRYDQDSRQVKSIFMDVLEHTGVDNRYYNNSRIQDFHEWLYSATVSPFKASITFGDSIPIGPGNGSQLYRAAKFGDTAAEYASWFANDTYPWRDLFTAYVIPDALYVNGVTMPAAVPVAPKSKVYYQGGGWFWEDNVTSDSLMGAVWAATGVGYIDAHAHKESNAIYVAAYGEHVLLNSGYPGYEQSWNGYSWDWFNNNANSANTVLVNNADHSSKNGGGVTEGFTSHGFDYACSDDGDALGNDSHLRSFIFVKPQDGKNGYFVLFDEVDADPGETVNVLLHPNTAADTVDGIETVSDRREYQATIDGLVLDGNTDIKLTVFYGTVPASVTMLNGAIGHSGYGDGGFEAKYLNAKYDTDSSGNVQVTTVLFPHNDTHAKATMTRLYDATGRGVSVDHGGGVVDYTLASDGVTDVTLSSAYFKAKSVVFRKLGSELEFYFARDSVKFLTDDDIGFEADSAISIHLSGAGPLGTWWGMIRSDGVGNVKFSHPDLEGVWMGGGWLTPIASGDGWISVYVEAGTHDDLVLWLGFPNPEPATAAVLLVGAFGILRRRKRKR